jgi:conjugative relaxase-like TrwC/TraI family protein
MTLHKLSVGDGYTYLTQKVAAFDASERGHTSLGDYYTQRGEAPGTWTGRGLAGLVGSDRLREVDEEQMRSLFGHGRHPDAGRLDAEEIAWGRTPVRGMEAGNLGQPFACPVVDVDGFRARCARLFAAFNLAHGRPALAPVEPGTRAAIRTAEAQRMFEKAQGRAPASDRELAGFVARASRPSPVVVAGYDLTFSPVKSVSALWALAPQAVAEQVAAAHHAAVAQTVAWLEEHACFTRVGAKGIRQVEAANGFIAASFVHRDSRAGDPDLHTHVAVSNKVQSADGRWRALDGRVVYKAAVAASEHYNTRLEAELIARVGVRFGERPDTEAGRRPVRELEGMDSRLLEAWSSRRRAIDSRRGELATAFQATHGRSPTAVESLALAQQATLETREGKHEPRSLLEQRTAWRREALAVLGGRRALTQMLDRVISSSSSVRRDPASQAWVHAAAEQVIRSVSAHRATWQYWHVHAEAERVARFASALDDETVKRVTNAALSPALSIPLQDGDPIQEPASLRRSDGASMYSVAGAKLYTSQAVLDAEALLQIAAGRHDGHRVVPAVVELALLEATANGIELNPDQAQLVRDLASSGARLQLAIAPAGAGKTTALASLARAWVANGGDVLGLAPSAVATAALHDSIEVTCDTIAKLVWSLDNDCLPEWAVAIGPKSLVVVDEAGMAGTCDLARITEYVLGRGGSIRLIGDHQQLASVSAGGILSEIAATHGAVTLSQLVRFSDPAEAAATVAIRDGDSIGLGFYLDRDRVHVGDVATCTEHAYRSWSADIRLGKDAVLLAATRELVQELNERARADRLTESGRSPGR